MSFPLQEKRYDAVLALMKQTFGADAQEGKAGRDPRRLITHYLEMQKLLPGEGTQRALLLYGMCAPANSLGKKGDFYLEADAGFLWGPKTKHGWQDMMPLHEDYQASDTFIKEALGVSGVIR